MGAERWNGSRMNFAFRNGATFPERGMEPGLLRIVTIEDQRWVVRAVRRVRGERTQRTASLRFFNGAISRYANDYPPNWPSLSETELSTIFARAEPRA